MTYSEALNAIRPGVHLVVVKSPDGWPYTCFAVPGDTLIVRKAQGNNVWGKVHMANGRIDNEYDRPPFAMAFSWTWLANKLREGALAVELSVADKIKKIVDEALTIA